MSTSVPLARQSVRSNYSGADHFDLVIIGAGLSGLSSGLMWLKNTTGRKTLIVEKNSYPGGYCTAYERKGFVFETTQLFPDIMNILDYLEIDISLKQYQGTFMRRIIVDGGTTDEFRIPADPENFISYLSEQFPEQRDNISKMMHYAMDLFRQVRKLKANAGFADKLTIPFIAPKVVANLNRSFSQMLDRFGITDTRLRDVMETFTSFSGVPGSKASAILTSGAMLSSMTRCFRPHGFFDEFPARLAEKYQQLGGELLLGAEVDRILVKNGTVTGVRLGDSGTVINAGKVITTIDPMLAMRRLVGSEHLPAKYIQQLDRTVMSVSSINIALGLDEHIDLQKLDLDYPYNVVSTGSGTAERLFEGFLEGDHKFSSDCFHFAVICPSLTTGGKPVITLRCTPFALDGWADLRNHDYRAYRRKKEQWADFFIDLAERYMIPGLKAHILVRDISTPATYARYSGSPTGSIYDIASLVSQFGPKRLPMKTPVKNLYQPKFAHGLYGTMMNGVQVVDLLLDRKFNNGNSLFNPN